MSYRDLEINGGRTSLRDGRLSFPMLVQVSDDMTGFLLDAYGIEAARAADYTLWCESPAIAPISELLDSSEPTFGDSVVFLENKEEYRLILPGDMFSRVSEELSAALEEQVGIIAFPFLLGPWSRLAWILRGIPEEDIRLDYPMLVLSRVSPMGKPHHASSSSVTKRDVYGPASPVWYFDNRCRVAAHEEWANLYRKGLIKGAEDR